MYQQDEQYLAAKRRVKSKADFYRHLMSFFVTGVVLLVINLVTSPHSLWFYWPLFGWGIGVLCHGARVLTNDHFGKDWEERQIEKEMNRRS